MKKYLKKKFCSSDLYDNVYSDNDDDTSGKDTGK